MNRNHSILTLTSLVLVIFLFAPIIIRTIDGTLNGQFRKISITTKSSDSPVKADSQMPFEEKEKEEGVDNSMSHLSPIYVVFAFTSFISIKHTFYSGVQFTGFHGGTPIYLAMRSILV